MLNRLARFRIALLVNPVPQHWAHAADARVAR
jgi:hypothetical protein